jgi:signal transduction histidine kinase
MSDVSDLRSRIGGRWAISVRGWAVLAVLSILAHGTSALMGDVTAPRPLLAYVVAGVSALAFGLVLLVGDRTYFRHRAERPVSITAVVVLGVLVGLAQSVTGHLLFAYLQFEPNPTPFGRILILAMVGPVLLIAVGLLFNEIDAYTRERDLLLLRAADLRARVVERGELSRTIEEAVNEEVLTTTRTILGDLDQAHPSMSPEERLAMARALQRTAHQELRPLSRRLYDTPRAPLPKVRSGEALRAALARQPISPGWCGLLTLVVTFTYTVEQVSREQAIIATLLQAGMVYGTLRAVVWLGTRGDRRRASLLIIGALAAAAVTTVKSIVLQQVGLSDFTSSVFALNAIWTPLSTIGVSIVVAAIGSRGETLRQLEYEVDEQVLEEIIANRELVRVSRELAGHVHGTLQSTLLATAFAIENATRTNDGAAFDAAVAGARQALTEAYPRSPVRRDVTGEIARHVELWKEFTEITTTVHAPVDCPPRLILDVGRIVEEGIGNAKKHGGARRIHIAVESPDPAILRVSISDDGIGPESNGEGLGTTLFDELAPGRWSLRSNPAGAGALLIVDLPLG